MKLNLVSRFRSTLSLGLVAGLSVLLICGSVAYAKFSSSAWASIKPAIAKVPTTVGSIASVNVVNFGKLVYTGPLNVSPTITRVRGDVGPLTSDDGTVFSNYQKVLPTHTSGYYREFVVPPSGGTDHTIKISSPGPMCLVLGTGGELYFTGDHYSTFTRIH